MAASPPRVPPMIGLRRLVLEPAEACATLAEGSIALLEQIFLTMLLVDDLTGVVSILSYNVVNLVVSVAITADVVLLLPQISEGIPTLLVLLACVRI